MNGALGADAWYSGVNLAERLNFSNSDCRFRTSRKGAEDRRPLNLVRYTLKGNSPQKVN